MEFPDVAKNKKDQTINDALDENNAPFSGFLTGIKSFSCDSKKESVENFGITESQPSINVDSLDDPEIIEQAINHCLNIGSFKCLDFLLSNFRSFNVTPVFDALCIVDIVKNYKDFEGIEIIKLLLKHRVMIKCVNDQIQSKLDSYLQDNDEINDFTKIDKSQFHHELGKEESKKSSLFFDKDGEDLSIESSIHSL